MSAPALERKRRREKHAELQSRIVREALNWFARRSSRTTTAEETPLYNACWALEKFETED